MLRPAQRFVGALRQDADILLLPSLLAPAYLLCCAALRSAGVRLLCLPGAGRPLGQQILPLAPLLEAAEQNRGRGLHAKRGCARPCAVQSDADGHSYMLPGDMLRSVVPVYPPEGSPYIRSGSLAGEPNPEAPLEVGGRAGLCFGVGCK